MGNFTDYLASIWPLTPLFLFIIGITFRLLDNSSYIFLKKEILINSSNVSRTSLKEQIQGTDDPQFAKQLKRALIFRNLQQSFLIAALISLPISLGLFFLG